MSCNLWNIVLKEKNGMIGYRMAINTLVVYLVILWLTRSCSLLLLPSITECTRFSHIASPGKYKNSILEECLLPNTYCFHTIVKLKTLSNQGKSGTICTRYLFYAPSPDMIANFFSFIVVFSKRTNIWYRRDA